MRRMVVAAAVAMSGCTPPTPAPGVAKPAQTVPRSERELSTLSADAHVVLLQGSAPDVYLAIAQGSGSTTSYLTRSLVHHFVLWQAVYQFPVVHIDDAQLAAIPRGPDTPFYDNVMLRGDGTLGEVTSTIYVTGSDQRHAYPDADTLAAANRDARSTHVVPDAALRDLPAGAPVPRPAQMYVFAIDNFHIDKTRSRHRDTVVAVSGLHVGDFTQGSKTGYRSTPSRVDHFGDMDDGTHPTSISFGPVAGDDAQDMILSYAFINSPSISDMSLQQIQWVLAYEGLYGLWTRKPAGNKDPRSLLVNLGFWNSPDSRPIPGYITSKIGWHAIGLTSSPTDLIPLALAIANSGIAVLNPDCDGPLAVDAVALPLATVHASTSDALVYRETRSYAGTDSPSGCGSNSRYSITWSVRRIGGLEVAASSLDFGTQPISSIGYRTLALRNARRDRAIAIRNVRTSDAHFVPSPTSLDVPVADADGKAPATPIIVMFKPDHVGAASAQLVFDTDDPETPSITVSLAGSGAPPCAPSCDGVHCNQSDGCGGTCGCSGDSECNTSKNVCESHTCKAGQVWCDCNEPARCMASAVCQRTCKN